MSYATFQEFVQNKNKVKPPKENKPKDAGGKGQVGTAAPYTPPTQPVDPNKNKNKDGFANDGDKAFVYNPKTNTPEKVGEGGAVIPTWPKTKSEEWIKSTKGLTLAEFTQKLRSEAVRSPQAVIETVAACKNSPNTLSSLVREMKRKGLLGALVSEALNHEESYRQIAQLMENDESYAKKLARAMNEMVAPPMHNTSDEEDEEEDIHHHDDDDMDNMDKLNHHHANLGDDDEDDMGDDEDNEDDDDMNMDDDDMDMDSDHEDKKMKFPKKKHAHDHLLNAMKSHPPMANSMQGMGNGFGNGM
jgi:hypothetical protein